jgi:hypothetical protein
LSNTNSLVLITTALNPPPGVFVLEMTNVAKRKITAKGAVFFWCASGVEKIVIADATGGTLLDDSEVLMIWQMGVEVEKINYKQDVYFPVNKGKGRAEGELIKFAMYNSEFIKNANHFFKCTGKVYCRNFPDVLNVIRINNLQNMFWQEPYFGASPSMDSRFFYTSKVFCENFLIRAYESINDRGYISAETALFNLAKERLKFCQSLRPNLSGFSGSLDRPYFDLSLGPIDNYFPCWVGE